MSSTNPVKRHIILIGFRGVGKTSVAKVLKKKLKLPLYDSDKEIVKESGLSIPEIFTIHGESYFRTLEEKVIQDLCLNIDPIILSTGGGVILSEQNRLILKANGIIILLTASEKTIFNRIQGDKNRPALTNKEFLEEIQVLINYRNPLYQLLKDFEVDTDTINPEITSTKIINFLENFRFHQKGN